MSRFGVWIHPGAPTRVEAWGELCISTVPDLQACVLRAIDERPGSPLVVDLRRVWFCDLAGLRAAWWMRDLGRSVGAEVEVCESAAIRHVARLVGQLRAARIA
ncbi:MAG TPA: STAS domain-containing protein [Gaiellales bacterium]|jgi:anti-anti-sigma regulatory factor|nr:STAS domain-containing protein [Gaiellales bacterium]